MNKDNIIKSFGILLEMLTDRGHNVGHLTEANLNEVLKLDNLKTAIEVIINGIKVVYYTQPKPKWSDLKKFFEDEEPFEGYILIVNESLAPNHVKSINALNMNIEVRTLASLQFNIMKHVLVPKHEVVKDKAVIDELLEKYSLKTKFQFPILLKADPVARWLGLKNGDVVKVTRSSPTAGEYIMYRCCL
jgi:DNA-directed RNA polymerase subunit H (RpoH/RPB5)